MKLEGATHYFLAPPRLIISNLDIDLNPSREPKRPYALI
jgi:hypothetical protein